MDDSSGWTSSRIQDCFDITLGKMLSKEASEGAGRFRYLANRNVQWNRLDLRDLKTMHFTAEERIKYGLVSGDLLVTEGGEIGRTATWNGELQDCYFQNALHRLRALGSVDPRYMMHYMRYAANHGLFAHLANQTSIAHLPKEKFERWQVSHPVSLAEQRRIAEILDAIDEQIGAGMGLQDKDDVAHNALLRTLAEPILRRLRRLEASQVTDLDGVASDLWAVRPLGTLLESIEVGVSPNLHDRPAKQGEWGVLKVGAVRRSGFVESENKVVHAAHLINPSIEVRHGDLLMSRANTIELVGHSCVVDSPRAGLMLSDKTLRLVVSRDAGIPVFVNEMLAMPEVQRQIGVAATGTSGSMKNISQEAIRRLMIPWSSVETQARVVDLVRKHQVRRQAWISELAKLQRMKQGLMDDLLTGRVRVPRVAVG